MSKKVTDKGEVEQAACYINPLTDFGFKRIFGTKAPSQQIFRKIIPCSRNIEVNPQ